MLSQACKQLACASRGMAAADRSAVTGARAALAAVHARCCGNVPPADRAEFAAFAGVLVLGLAGAGIAHCKQEPCEPERAVEMSNWSGTHTLLADRLYSPESKEELQALVLWASSQGQKVRPIGTGLSPNGLALDRKGMLSMAQLDGIVDVDVDGMTITVEAGARVSQILEELRKHGLTLANFSSITEQQIAGWTQTSAHGTGARIPCVDEMIQNMTVVTPGQGTLELAEGGSDDALFRWVRVAMGTLGVVSQVTLKCIPRYTLHERTYCTTVEDLRKNHARLLQTCRHVRYMWVPFTDTIVVVVSDIAEPGAQAAQMLPEKERVKPLRELLKQLLPSCGDVSGDNFAQLREKCLAIDPLNPRHVAKVNQAEAEFWKLSQGERIDDSTAILGFECGGSQWVLENCFPCGTIDKPSLADIDYMVEIKQTIEKEGIPAASPIEQRWTSRSTSPMSPAYSPNKDAIFSWIGVIMYTSDEIAPQVRDSFRYLAERHVDQTFKYDGAFHWAKIDLDFHQGEARLADLKRNYGKRFDLSEFRKLRKSLDPKNLFGNKLTDTALAA